MSPARLLLLLACTWVSAAQAALPPAARCAAWPAWERFRGELIDGSGRVVDYSTPARHTVSEGQSYALFFALVAGDRATFERVLKWTEDNLAAGDLTAHLPAWRWGRGDDGIWGVLDANPAADADVWIAYALTEAGRLWQVRRYSALAQVLGARILREETAQLPGLGRTLLPGPVGFHPADDQWRLNASYVPLMVLRRLAAASGDVDWRPLLESSRRLIVGSAPHGYAGDWTLYRAGSGFEPDATSARAGSYNAIRVYLWAGMMAAHDPLRREVLAALAPMARAVGARELPPESVDVDTGAVRGNGPTGFSAALAPFLRAYGMDAAAAAQLRRVEADPPAGHRENYYDNVLTLFGQGWAQGRFRFDAGGALLPLRDPACDASSSSSPR